MKDDSDFKTNTSRVHVRLKRLTCLADIFEDHRAAELSAKLEAAGLPHAPITSPDQLVDDVHLDVHLKESGGLAPITTDEGTSSHTVLLPLLMNDQRLQAYRPLPKVDEHTDEILAELNSPHDVS